MSVYSRSSAWDALRKRPTEPDSPSKKSTLSSKKSTLSTMSRFRRTDPLLSIIEESCPHEARRPSEKILDTFGEAMEFLRGEIIGRNQILEGPFGPRLKLYLDYTASGQGLSFINKFMTEIRESFANTHTEDSETGRFMTSCLNDALRSIEECLNARGEFVAICTGTGCTGAILRLQQILGIYVPPACWSTLGAPFQDIQGRSRWCCRRRKSSLRGGPGKGPPLQLLPNDTSADSSGLPDWWRAREAVKAVLRERGDLPLVLVGGYEHHSNEVSWRHGLCDVVRVPLTSSFELDLARLAEILRDHRAAAPRRTIIGSFSACSNVTGMRTDIKAVSRLLRRVGASFFVDFAASGPYEEIDCCPEGEEGLFDGCFLSPHKFLGGDGSCGLLMLRKSIYDLHLPPTFAGGGTVKAVGKQFHAFSDDIVERENAGTPGALQIYQCALAFEVKDLIGVERIHRREQELVGDLFAWLRATHPTEVHVLGNPDPGLRFPIVSFNVVAPQPLHPRFVTRLLSDVFGVQTRAGCSCAGPHGSDLFGITPAQEAEVFGWIAEDAGLMSMKPGWCRLNLHYSMDDDELRYLKTALSFVVEHGARFLAVYSLDACSGAWEYKPPARERPGLDAKHLSEKAADRPVLSLQSALAGGTKRRQSASLDAAARRKILDAQVSSAKQLLKYLPQDPALVPPPAPLSDLRLAGQGPQAFFVVGEGQVHNVWKMEEAVARHAAQGKAKPAAKAAAAAPDRAVPPEDDEIGDVVEV